MRFVGPWLPVAAICFVNLAVTATTASAAITITKAEIAAGRLVVQGSRTGTAPSIILDDQFTAGVIGGNFAFSLLYLPPDCMIDLKGDGGTAGTLTAIVANCGPRGLSARGAWSDASAFFENDVVTSGGSSYRAKRSNINKPPGTSGNDWEVLAAKGARGIQGATGPAGTTGPTGPQGSTGAMGAQGPAGTQGPVGAAGPAGTQGPPGPTLQKRTGFSNVAIPGTFSPIVQLASLSFTPPKDGTALLRSRGFCNLNAGGDNANVKIAAGTSVATVFDAGDLKSYGIIEVPVSGFTQAMWTSEQELSVSAGVATTVFLAGRAQVGFSNADCSGTFQVEVYTGTLP